MAKPMAVNITSTDIAISKLYMESRADDGSAENPQVAALVRLGTSLAECVPASWSTILELGDLGVVASRAQLCAVAWNGDKDVSIYNATAQSLLAECCGPSLPGATNLLVNVTLAGGVQVSLPAWYGTFAANVTKQELLRAVTASVTEPACADGLTFDVSLNTTFNVTVYLETLLATLVTGGLHVGMPCWRGGEGVYIAICIYIYGAGAYQAARPVLADSHGQDV